MGKKIRIDNKDYDFDKLGLQGKKHAVSLKFVNARLHELNETKSLLQRAQRGYVEDLKIEMLSAKSGMLLNDE